MGRGGGWRVTDWVREVSRGLVDAAQLSPNLLLPPPFPLLLPLLSLFHSPLILSLFLFPLPCPPVIAMPFHGLTKETDGGERRRGKRVKKSVNGRKE